MARTRSNRVLKTVALVVLSAVAALAVGEGALRIIGFRFPIAPDRVEFGWPDPEVLYDVYDMDAELFWVTKDYENRLRRLRSEPHEIVFLGDSTTEYGRYPDLLLRRLKRRYPEHRLRWQALGVGGWSTFQGLKQMERQIADASPRIAMLYFGWNDHWIGFGVEDAEIHRLTSGVPSWARALRIVQLLFKTRLALAIRDADDSTLRVSPEAFRANLTEMVRIAQRAKIVPVLVTPASSHESEREPPYLSERFIRDLSQLVPLHQRYVKIVREVSASENVLLCDAAAAFAEVPKPILRDRYFKEDGIHLTVEGDAHLAGLLETCLARDERTSGVWREAPLRE